jgi:hypothetical protein
MSWLNFGGKKRNQAQGFGDSSKTKSRKRPKSFILEKIVTPSAGIGDWQHEFDHLHQLLGSLSLSDLHLPNFFADGGVCPIDPSGAPTNNLPPLIDFDPLGLYNNGIATQTPYNPGGAFETLPVALIPVDPQSPNPNNPNAIRQLLDFPLASQPLVGTIDTGVSAGSPYLNYANIKQGHDYVGGDDNPLLNPGEGSEHGTFMLGIIDAINKTAPKWVGRAIDSGRWADSLVEFVDAAKASGQKNAIANLSLDLTQKNADGSVTTRYELTPPERSAIEYARQNGVMLVVAAGNDGGVMSVLGQASQEFNNIFTVGAGDINGRSNYSSYGRGLDILADGGTTEHPALSTVGNDLGTMAGTSVATAKVAGAASLVWAANPALNYRQVMEILEKTARDLGTPGRDDETGFGFLNTLAAVELAKKTKPEVYNPIDFGTPTTWGGEGKVTPMERAVNITNENFSAWVVSSNGITLRNSPNTSDRSNFVVKTGDTLTFDGWTYGEQLSDLTTGEADALWYRFRYNGGTYWVPSAWTGGYPGSRPPLLPPAQAPAQQYQQPPVSQQPTNNTVYLSTNAGEILQVDQSTGASHKIYQGRAFTDLAVAPNGKLYGCTFYDGLYEINPSTGAERYVGALAGGSLNSLTFSTDGRLYGADQINGNLFQISPDNGQMNLIGNLGGPSSGDLVFNGANEILATVSSPNTSLNDRLVAVNLATGNSRYIGDLGLLEVYGLSWENGQLTAYTSDRRKLAIDPNTAKATVVGTVSSNGLIWGAATKPATASSPTDDVRQKFLYAASLYPQVGAAITGMQDQGGGVFRQEFERAIMIWNGQQVTVYETKGRSVSPTSPSPTPQVNNSSGFTPVLNFNSGGKSPNGNWIFLNQGDKGQQIEQIKQKILNLENQINAIEASKATYGSQISEKEKAVKDKKDQANKLSWPNSWNPLDWLKAGQLTIEAGLIEYGTLPQLRAQYSATTTRLNELKQELALSRQELDKLHPLPISVAEAQRYFKSQFNPDAPRPNANCGPTSLAMAFAVLNLEPSGLTIQQSIDTAKKFTLPWSQPADGARDFEIERGILKGGGTNIENIGKSDIPTERWAALERCLSEGKPVVAFGKTNAEWSKSIGYPNNPVDHVIAILGKTPAPEGKYIVGDPEAQNCVAVTKEQLKDFFRIYGEAPAGRAFSR